MCVRLEGVPAGEGYVVRWDPMGAGDPSGAPRLAEFQVVPGTETQVWVP